MPRAAAAAAYLKYASRHDARMAHYEAAHALAREHNLPVAYIDQLQAIESMDDPDDVRDLQKRSLECKGTSEFIAAFPRGSEWRKWDLHMHTPASWDWKGGPRLRSLDNAKRIEVADSCLAALEATDVAVFAVQDHCTFEGYRLLRERIVARPTLFTKTLIPGIELRLEAPTPKRLNYHILFAPLVPVVRLEAFLCQLKMPNGTAFTRHDLIAYANALDGGKKREFRIAPSDNPTDDELLDAAYKCARVTRESVFDALDQLPPNAAVVNLDNESIMHLLVPCFKEAARRRQVIVVTHNPNLAVVADADQVIHAKIDRADGHRIEYITGSLESSVVSRLAVNVLEGTRPAFNQRAKVYELIA